MSHQIFKITSLKLTGTYSFIVSFDDNTSQEIDLNGMLYGELYEPLNNPDFFKQVRIDPEIKTLVWPNGADFDPAVLHDWPKTKFLFMKS
jgi:Protein of unknown function (DUF2442)